MAESKSLAIIGSGTFGLSTALAWRKEYPAARISLIDVKAPLHPHPPSLSQAPSPSNPDQIIPASEDVAKIIRAAYTSPAYVRLARDALHAWRTKAPYADFFHASGWVVADALSGGRNMASTGGEEIGRERFAEAFPGSTLEDGYVISEDAEPGWVEASRCLEVVLQVALSQGIEYRTGEAVGLWWQGSRCTGVEMRDGEDVRAENVLLAMGPWTPSFLRKCGIPASIPCEVAGVTAVGVQLDEDEYRRYRDMPILIVTGAGLGKYSSLHHCCIIKTQSDHEQEI
jgi:sarcosine oxidase / L-pipecolate oxidase